MATIYVWLPKNDRLSNVGHAAMEIYYGTYCSFWPHNTKNLGNLYQSDTHATVYSYEEESDPNSRWCKRKADYRVTLSCLDEEMMHDYWNRIISKGMDYHILKRNCSTIVGRAIHKGVEEKIENMSKSDLALLNLRFAKNMMGYRISGFFNPDKWSTGTVAGWLVEDDHYTPEQVLHLARALRDHFE